MTRTVAAAAAAVTGLMSSGENSDGAGRRRLIERHLPGAR